MQLSKYHINKLQHHKGIDVPNNSVFTLPEKVLQFGTGVLLRGLPDFFINKANNNHIFNGRIVVVKSTAGSVNDFMQQDALYTTCMQGIENGIKVEETIINASISRVLSASTEWQSILQCAHSPEMEIIISNTTEVGIVLNESDLINENSPKSFPGKLLAFLLERYVAFNGDPNKGMVIIPCELITDNGYQLKSIVLELAKLNQLTQHFIDWLVHSNDFCNSLVDRIVPGKPSELTKHYIQSEFGYSDELMIMLECFSFWAIESSSERVKKILSFTQADDGIVIANDINKFKELKLRLLNGLHTFATGVAFLSGIETVMHAMDDTLISQYIIRLSSQEIVTAIVGDEINSTEAKRFANKVLDRFRNPFIQHNWSSIAVQYSLKMKMRNVDLIKKYYQKTNHVPQYMALGFAAFIRYMKSEQHEDNDYYGTYNGMKYIIKDENAAYFSMLWIKNSKETIVHSILSDKHFWGVDLTKYPRFETAVHKFLQLLSTQSISEILQNINQKILVE